MNQLFDFFFTNERLRWRVYVAASTASVIYGLVNLWVFHRNEQRVFSETVCVLVVVLFISLLGVIWSTRPRDFVTESSSRQLPRSSLKFIGAGVVAVVFLTNMLRIDVPAFQASLAAFTLEHIATQMDSVQAASLSFEQLDARFRRIETIVANSSASQIPVDAGVLKKTQSSLSRYLVRRPLPDQINQAGWVAAIDLQSLAFARDIQAGQITPRQIPKEGYPINSFLLLDHDVQFQGEHSLLLVGDEIGIKDASVTFDKVDFKGNWIPLVLIDDGASALVRDSIFQAGAQVLDRITWVNVRFEKTRILYNGGPLRLRNVSFKDCDLRDLEPPFHVEQELLKRIREAHGQPVTYVYEPITPGRKDTPR